MSTADTSIYKNPMSSLNIEATHGVLLADIHFGVR